MLQRAPWFAEILVVLGLGLLAAWLGRAWGLSRGPLLLVAGGWFLWHLFNLWRLIRALEQGLSRLPGSTPGLWGYVFYRVELRLRKERGRKKRVRRLLKEFFSTAKALPDPTIVLNRDFEILWLNKAARQIFHLRKADVSRRITDLVRLPAFRQWLSSSEPGEPVELELPFRPPVIAHLRRIPYGRNQFLLLARDVTEHRSLERVRHDFIANASHELRTPLTVFQGSLEEVMDKLGENPDTEQPLRWMQRQSDRMQAILADLLTLARLEEQVPKRDTWRPVRMGALIQSVCTDARLLSDKLGGHEFHLELDEDLTVLGEHEGLRILVGNLVTNAVRYTPSGGRITVRWFRDPGGACCRVTDTGPGISHKHVPRLTERFYRVDAGRSRGSGGTGLGLAIVKHVLELYGTRLDIATQVGAGSTFSFTIPASMIVDSKPVLTAGRQVEGL